MLWKELVLFSPCFCSEALHFLKELRTKLMLSDSMIKTQITKPANTHTNAKISGRLQWLQDNVMPTTNPAVRPRQRFYQQWRKANRDSWRSQNSALIMSPFYVLIGCDLPLIAPFIISTAGHLCVPFEVSIVLIIPACWPSSMHVK